MTTTPSTSSAMAADGSDTDKNLATTTEVNFSSIASDAAGLTSQQLTELISELEKQRVRAEASERATVSKARDASSLNLFNWQLEAIESWRTANHHGVVEAVTGTGKTRVGLAAILEATKSGLRTIVYVPSLALQRQWIEQIQVLLPDLNVTDVADASQHAAWDVTVITIQSAIRRKLLRDGERALLIADECHRYGAPKFQTGLRPENFVMRLGLSATRHRGDSGDETLESFFGSTCFAMDYERAVRDELIAPFKIAFVRVPFTPVERAEYEQLSEEMKDARTKLLGSVPIEPFAEFMQGVQQLANDRSNRKSGVARWYLKRFSDRRSLLAASSQKQIALRALTPVVEASQGTLVFTQTKDSAEAAAAILNEQGVSSAAVDSGVDSEERVEVIRLLGAGKMKALAAPTLLDEGIDLPRVDLGIVISATHQRRQMIQRFGRVLRKKPDGATAKFVVFVLSGSSEDPTSVTHDLTLADELRPFAMGAENFDLEVEEELNRLIEFLEPSLDSSQVPSFQKLSDEASTADATQQPDDEESDFIFVPNREEPLPRTTTSAQIEVSPPESPAVPERVRIKLTEAQIEPSRYPQIAGPGVDGDKYYQSDIRKYAVLTREEEHTLMERIRQGEAARRQVDTAKIRTRAEMKQLRKQIRIGQEAKEFFVVSNLRLVASLARKALRRVSHLELMDLIQEGNRGLLKAIERFDHKRGTKFSTYATWWIRQSMDRAIDDTELLIRVPVHMATEIRKLDKIRSQHESTTGTQLSIDEIATLADQPVEAVRKAQDAVLTIVELEAAANLADERQLRFEDEIEQREIRLQVERALPAILDPREESVIRYRYGFENDAEPMTLDEIGVILGVTRERIRQLQKGAEKKLRERLPFFLGIKSDLPATASSRPKPGRSQKSVKPASVTTSRVTATPSPKIQTSVRDVEQSNESSFVLSTPPVPPPTLLPITLEVDTTRTPGERVSDTHSPSSEPVTPDIEGDENSYAGPTPEQLLAKVPSLTLKMADRIVTALKAGKSPEDAIVWATGSSRGWRYQQVLAALQLPPPPPPRGPRQALKDRLALAMKPISRRQE